MWWFLAVFGWDGVGLGGERGEGRGAGRDDWMDGIGKDWKGLE